MKMSPFLAASLGALSGVGVTFLVMRDAPVEEGDNFSQNAFVVPVESEDDPFSDQNENPLRSLSGKWVSVDGELTAELDYQILRFGNIPDWPDINERHFLIGSDWQFMTNSAFYSISKYRPEADQISVIRQDQATRDYASFNLYREGSPHARSRVALADKTPPPKVKALLDAIPTIQAAETKSSVMQRLGLTDDDSLEVLCGTMEHGYSDMIFSLGIDNEWMLRLDFSVESPNQDPSEAVIRRFQIVRGYVDDVREGRIDIEKWVFPYFFEGETITDPVVSVHNEAQPN